MGVLYIVDLHPVAATQLAMLAEFCHGLQKEEKFQKLNDNKALSEGIKLKKIIN